MTLPEPALRHLQRMTDDTSLFEHAIGSLPHRALGYCTDDAGRGLAVAVRSDEAIAEDLAERWLSFLVQAHDGDGRFRLRMGFDRRWTADPSSDDACGRAIFGIGITAAISPWAHIGREARRLFELAAPFRSAYPRATAHALVGAAELVVSDERCVSARSLVEDGLASLPRGTDNERWMWPEPRLAYGNALLPEALIAGGHAIGDDDAVNEGLRLLRWLVDAETLGDHFSFTSSAGVVLTMRARRSISSRSRRVRSRTRVPERSLSRTTTPGWNRSAHALRGSMGSTTRAWRCSIPRPVAASTAWKGQASIRTRAPSRRSRSSPRCNTRRCRNEVRAPLSEPRGARRAADPR